MADQLCARRHLALGAFGRDRVGVLEGEAGERYGKLRRLFARLIRVNHDKQGKQATQLSVTFPSITFEDAYAISTECAKRKMAAAFWRSASDSMRSSSLVAVLL